MTCSIADRPQARTSKTNVSAHRDNPPVGGLSVPIGYLKAIIGPDGLGAEYAAAVRTSSPFE